MPTQTLLRGRAQSQPASRTTIIAVFGVLAVLILGMLASITLDPLTRDVTVEDQWLVGP